MKSNKKRLLFVLAILTMAIVLSFVFVACDKAGTDKTGTDIVADYKVTIHPNNGQNDIVWDITKAIPTITKDGYHIAGYFLDAQLTISTTLESLKATGITKNIDVYVKWEEDICEHVEVTDVAVEPTCTEKGLTEGKHCSKCGKILKAQTEIDALGHDLETHNGQEATCTEKGWKAYVTCKREGCKHTTYEEIPALGHTGGTATCTEQAVCERCNEKYGKPLGHDLEHHAGQPATCTEKGWHAYDTCKRDGCTYTTYQEIDALGHDLETHNGQEATCTEKGWKAYVTCKREGCDHTTYEEIPALGHTGGTATCTEQATCERCNEKYGSALGHKYGDLISKIEPTCSATGTEAHYKCSVCNKVFKDDEHKTETTLADLTIAINPNAHNFGNWIKNEGADTHTRVCSFNNEHTETENCFGGTATCTEQAVCEKCNAKYGKALGHDYQNGVCTRCGTERASEGLEYSLNSDETGYTVTGIGSCTDTEIVIPSKHNSKPVTSIASSAFYRCTGLTSITIPNSVTSIGDSAFEGCSGLTSITIPDSVTKISSWTFEDCSGLTSITIPDSVTSIGYRAFLGCTGLVNITVADNNTKYHSSGNCLVETASKTLILGCNTSVIPNDGSVTNIGQGAFAGCTNLTSITIPDSVTSIGDNTFDGCTGLVSVTIGNGVTRIVSSAFEGCTGLMNITIPDSVTSISGGAFRGCSKLTSVTIGNGVISIGEGAFQGCMKLKDIYITDIVTWCNISGLDNLMGNSSNNKNLYINNELVTAVTIQDGITAISASAFRNCSGLTSITIGDSVTSIGAHAFAGCIGLVNISVADGNTKYHSSGNCLIETASNTLVLGCKTSVIPSDGSVTSIGEGAFFCCDELTSVTIPDGVTRIGNYAFAGCIELTSVTIPNSVTSIDNDAFFGCSRLKSIIFNGTIAQWNAVSKGNYWKLDVPRTCKVVCTDGTINI